MMKTVVLKINKNNPRNSLVKRAAGVLKAGGIIVFPTDTVYGLAAGAFDLGAQKKIYKLKGRSFRKPLVIMAHDAASLKHIVEINPDAAKLIKQFFPGPLTIVLPTTHLGKIAMGGRKDAGVRIPKDKIVSALIREFGSPIATTSANVSGKPSAKNAAQALRYFEGKAELALDGGASKFGKESTVIDMVKFPYVVLRKGCVSNKELLECLSKIDKSEIRNTRQIRNPNFEIRKKLQIQIDKNKI